METTRLVSDQIYDSILDAIVSKQWGVGEKIPSENQICKTFDTSRVSVRAAIHKLQAQGYIITKPGKGSFVIKNSITEQDSIVDDMSLSVEDYHYMTEFRRAIEFESIRLMCQNGNDKDFAYLREACNEMYAANDVESYVNSDYKFHYSIVLGSHNPLFKKVYDICRDTLYKYFLEMSGNNRDNNWDNAKKNHIAICECIINRKADEAIGIIEGTFEFNYNRLSRYFKK